MKVQTSMMIGMLIGVLAMASLASGQSGDDSKWLAGNDNITAITEPPPVCPPPGTEVNATTFVFRYNCSQYWVCETGVPILRTCSPGLIFNKILGVCDFPWATTCDIIESVVPAEARNVPVISPKLPDACRVGMEPDCPPPPIVGNATVCPDTTNCSRYWRCDNGVAKLNDCPPTLHYNEEFETCDFIWSANCKYDKNFEDNIIVKPVPVVVKPVPIVKMPRISEHCVSGDKPNCPPPGVEINATRCPDIYNCSRYWLCDNGQASLQDCPPGLEYNAAAETCDFDWSAQCVEEAATTTTTTTTTTTEAPVEVRSDNEYCVDGGPPRCPPPSVVFNVTFCRDTTNCSNYYMCDNFGSHHLSCPPGLEFNNAIDTCDFSWSANCVVGVIADAKKENKQPKVLPGNILSNILEFSKKIKLRH